MNPERDIFAWQLPKLFIEPRCHTFIGVSIGTALGLGVSAAGVGLGAASAAGAFSPTISAPNTAAEAEQMQALQAEYLPALLGVQAAQQEGGSYTLPPDIAQALEKEGVKLSEGQMSPQQTQQIQSIQSQIAALKQQQQGMQQFAGHGNHRMKNPQWSDLNTQISGLQNQLTGLQKQGGSMVNFAGQGTAQTQGEIEQQLAQGQLTEGQQFDPQFIAERLKEEQLANPQQFTTRANEYSQIENAIQHPQTSPVSDTLNNQVTERVNAGSNLTPEETAMLNEAVANQGGENGVNFGTDLTTGFAGEQRALNNVGAGAQFLSSGETPDEFAYRQQQQNIANLGSYASGATPEAQFGQVAGAGAPIAPQANTGYQPSFNGQAAAQQGAAGGINQFGEQVQQSLNTPNPWTLGLSGVLQGANALSSAGVF